MNEILRGVVSIERRGEGSRSEGDYAFLTDDHMNRVRLCRDSHLPFDDKFFEPLNGRRVCAEGERVGEWLVVSSVRCDETGQQTADQNGPQEEAGAESDVEAEAADNVDTEAEPRNE